MNEIRPKIRGLLNERQSLEKISIQTFPPCKAIDAVIDRFWHVCWALPEGEKYKQSNIPFPTQHLVLDPQNGSGFFGCTSGKFDYLLKGKGAVLGAKLKSGMGQSIVQKSMSELTDTHIPIHKLYPKDGMELEKMLLEQSVEKTLEAFNIHISQHFIEPTKDMIKVQNAVMKAEMDTQIFTLKNLSKALKISPRQIQRLFQNHIGLGPKWVINRYRMFEALDTLNGNSPVDLADLAIKLGFSDQAHFNNAFRSLTGFSPAKYTKRNRNSAN
ncbi:helix-turn-helix domain-containing protein [Lentilitoribacter sp. EG35]|uniref:helix-turn-helix domain-containing protein n=1 Tax=Lentilitoribacter sp. EG35 TaxID=3234192 RepID=UPI00345F3ABD